MAMESLEVANSKAKSLFGDSMQKQNDADGSENPGDDLLADLDSYLEDINDRLTISRMVSDSVIKGMVTAVTQEAAERISSKELEVVKLKETLGSSLGSDCEEQLSKLRHTIDTDKAMRLSERTKEISRLREELNLISKFLSSPESRHLVSHGSLDSEGWYNGKRSHFHHSVSESHLGNGKHDESQNSNNSSKSEHSDPYYLDHMNRDELIAYYNNEMTKLKRNHESKVQEMTEEFFSLKREYLKEKGSSLHLKKDKELTTLKNRIPEVISKLDGILVETEKIPAMFEETESRSGLMERLETLLAENRQLRDFLSDKKKEVKCLATQVSDAEERMSQHSLSEAKLLNSVRCLKSHIEDLHIEASLGVDVLACLLRETMSQINCRLEDSRGEYDNMHRYYENVVKEASRNAQPTCKCGVEDLDMVSIVTLELSEVIFRESWQEAKEAHDMLRQQYIEENKVRLSLEERALEKEKSLKIEIADKEWLKHEIHFLKDEKERFKQEAEAALQSESERLQLASKELENLRVQQRVLISQSSSDSEDLRRDLAGALEEVELYQSNMCKLNEKLELAGKEFREADEERRKLRALNQEKQNVISSHEANERETRKQMESMAVLIQGLSKAASDFESRVIKDVSKNCLRLKNVSSQSHLLKQKANILQRAKVLYKQKLEKRLADFQKAEAEVDLLGDEVDTLLGLLEKIYLALDHYSPVLQHYPGITETLKLVKRELSGVSTRSA